MEKRIYVLQAHCKNYNLNRINVLQRNCKHFHVKRINVNDYYIPTNAHRNSINSLLKLLKTCFGVLTPFSRILQVLSPEVMNY
jgi:hypothetical protein